MPRKPLLILAAIFLIAGVALAARSLWSPTTIADDTPRAFYSTDDGKTYFPLATKELPPFAHEGKEAVRAHVFRTSTGQTFVNHLERYKPDAKSTLESLRTHKGPPNIGAIQQAARVGREVKRPNEKVWTSSGDLKAAGLITLPKSPDNSPDPTALEP